MQSILGITVDEDLLRCWARWLAPEVQPFFVESLDIWSGLGVDPREISPELRDTYRVWNIDRALNVLWLTEGQFASMPRSDRAALVRSQVNHKRGAVPAVRQWADVLDAAMLRIQADGHRFVWWSSILDGHPERVLERVVSVDRFTSRHREVSESTWRTAADLLPAARALAGSFPQRSGPNCFGTVMAAAGITDAEDAWMLQAPFSEWLDTTCRPGGDDDEPGTVLVWRRNDGVPVHAAVTVGDGWALEKPSQEWSSPRAIVSVRDSIRAARTPGQRLERHQIQSAS